MGIGARLGAVLRLPRVAAQKMSRWRGMTDVWPFTMPQIAPYIKANSQEGWMAVVAILEAWLFAAPRTSARAYGRYQRAVSVRASKNGLPFVLHRERLGIRLSSGHCGLQLADALALIGEAK